MFVRLTTTAHASVVTRASASTATKALAQQTTTGPVIPTINVHQGIYVALTDHVPTVMRAPATGVMKVSVLIATKAGFV